MILIHPSSLGKIMTEPKAKSEVLSEGAKTYLTCLAKEIVYGFKSSFRSKETDKGLLVEDKAIELYNHVHFTCHVKNTERRQDEILDGECDIQDEDCIKDIKSAWSLATFPATRAMAHDSGYEWQLRGYMRLWDKPFAELAFCMVSTPEELFKYEDPALHLVDHIPPELRVTTVRYQRNDALEMKMLRKCVAAQEFVANMIDTIHSEHQYN